MAREFARQFYSSKAWQTCRDEYAKKAQHLCENCLKKGIIKPGVIVHHVEELTPYNIERPEIALSFNNLELLCRDCHAEMHKSNYEKGKRFTVDSYGRVRAKEIPPIGGKEL